MIESSLYQIRSNRLKWSSKCKITNFSDCKISKTAARMEEIILREKQNNTKCIYNYLIVRRVSGYSLISQITFSSKCSLLLLLSSKEFSIRRSLSKINSLPIPAVVQWWQPLLPYREYINKNVRTQLSNVLKKIYIRLPVLYKWWCHLLQNIKLSIIPIV